MKRVARGSATKCQLRVDSGRFDDQPTSYIHYTGKRWAVSGQITVEKEEGVWGWMKLQTDDAHREVWYGGGWRKRLAIVRP